MRWPRRCNGYPSDVRLEKADEPQTKVEMMRADGKKRVETNSICDFGCRLRANSLTTSTLKHDYLGQGA